MTKAFKCDSCGELSEGDSPVVARIDIRGRMEDFRPPEELRVERNTGVADRVRRFTGDEASDADLFMELCEGCARDLIPSSEAEGQAGTGPGEEGLAETVLDADEEPERPGARARERDGNDAG